MKFKQETKIHLVASIDILGARKLISEDEKDTFDLVYNIYEDAKNALMEHNALYSKDAYSDEKYKFKIFSDNIVIAQEFVEAKNNDWDRIVDKFLLLILSIQNKFFGENILVRGGVSIGEFYGDDLMVWGKALVESYDLESKCAIYPRIIITDQVKEKLDKEASCNVFGNVIMQDIDKLYYLNFLWQTNSEECILLSKKKVSFDNAALERCEEIIITFESYLTKYKKIFVIENNMAVKAKYGWVISYIEKKLDLANQILELIKSNTL